MADLTVQRKTSKHTAELTAPDQTIPASAKRTQKKQTSPSDVSQLADRPASEPALVLPQTDTGNTTIATRKKRAPSDPGAAEQTKTVQLAQLARADRIEHVVRETTIRNHPDTTATLLFNPNLQRMNKLIAGWEAQLAKQGLEVEICLGAGDLRRALLHVAADGPGDVELFIHFHNQDLPRLGLDSALAFLAERGVHIERELHKIFPEDKHLDMFVKDRTAIRDNLPYRGELGAFEGMGDTTINALLYSPTKNELFGNPGDLEALAEKRIGFLELAKSAKLEAPKKITGTKANTEYPATILRLALRCIRLELDLALAPNANGLRMDDSFNFVLRGFEHFFAGAPAEEIAKFALDEKYVEQFIKLFRNRSPEDLAKVRKVLLEKYAATAGVMKSLGLDLDALTKPDVLGRDRAANELRAVIGNARFDAIRPFVDKRTMKVENPFASAAGAEKLLEPITLRGVDRANIRMIPPELLARYSAKLSARVAAFDALGVDAKLDTLHKYEAAVKMFAGKAPARMLDEVSFAQKFFKGFRFVDISRLAEKDERPLLRFIEDEMGAKRPTAAQALARVARADAKTEELLGDIDTKIDRALEAGKKPVVFVDLDGTLYSYSSRYAHLLHRYDEEHGTKHFAGLGYESIPEERFEELLYERLGPKYGDIKSLEKEVESIKTFVSMEINSDAALLADVLNPALKEKLAAWTDRGAEVIALTARQPWQKRSTMQALERDQVSAGAIFVGDMKGATYTVKTEEIQKYVAANPGSVAVGFIDNDQRNVLKVAEALPELTGAQMFWKHSAGVPAMSLTRGTTHELYELLGGQ